MKVLLQDNHKNSYFIKKIITMNDFLRYLSTAPVLLTVWLTITSGFVIFINFIYPDALFVPF